MQHLDLKALQEIARTCPFGIMVINTDHVIIDINNHGAAVFEYLPEEMIGSDLSDYVSKDVNHAKVSNAFINNKDTVTREYDHTPTTGIAKSGRHIQVSIKIQHMSNGLAYAAFYDPAEYTSGDSLTNALTRNQFFIALNKLDTAYSLLFIDLNKFKVINDKLGHIAGDQVLRTVSRRLQNVLRETDLFCRYGGDEFIIVIPGERKAASAVSTKVQMLIKEPITTREETVNISCSIGVVYSDEATTVDGLIHIADQRMYEGKEK